MASSSDAETRYEYLLSLKSIRHGAQYAYRAAQENKLTAFDFHPQKMDEVTDLVCSTILRDFSPHQFGQIPPHGRWQHFETQNVPRLEDLLQRWKSAGVDDLESCRLLVDLFLVSVLLDAGAGDIWSFSEKSTGLHIERSEGLAVASLHAFNDGLFSSADIGVDAAGLKSLTVEGLGEAMQSTAENPLLGLEGRAVLLQDLGNILLSFPDIFGESGRPGNLVDYLLKKKTSSNQLSLGSLWDVLQKLLIPTWPAGRTQYNGKQLGDAWPLELLQNQNEPLHAGIQPFHKLTQWLTYSLTVIFERLLKVKWTGTEDLTGLPEYRNGGLYVDTGVLTLKPDVLKRGTAAADNSLPTFDPSDNVVVEWRALTVALLDRTLEVVNDMMAAKTEGTARALTLAQLLEAGTWKAGRELAAKHRPQTKSSPIILLSDGTLF